MYETDGCVMSTPEYGRDVYANSLDFFRETQRHVRKLFFVYYAYI